MGLSEFAFRLITGSLRQLNELELMVPTIVVLDEECQHVDNIDEEESVDERYVNAMFLQAGTSHTLGQNFSRAFGT